MARILRDIDRMSLPDQRRLLDWLDVNYAQTRIVSTTIQSMVPLIDAGVFLESLYYRLNVCCFDLNELAEPGHLQALL